jgi:hypothetical protein
VTAILGILGFLGSTVFLVSIFVPAWTWVAMLIYRALEISAFVLLAVCIIISPASFFKKTRGGVASTYVFSSFAFVFFLWAECAFYVASIWGRLWLAVGLFAGVVGVIPLAIVACLSAGRWADVGGIIVAISLIVAARLLALFLMRE